MFKKELYEYKENGKTKISMIKPSCEYTLMYRLIAEEGCLVTDYLTFSECIDIKVEDLYLWHEVYKDDINKEVSQMDDLTNSINTLKGETQELSKMDKDLVATTWEIDDRLYEVEWTLEDAGLGTTNPVTNLKMKGMGAMALSKFEQAQIIIMSGDYNKSVLEGQLSKYVKRNIITQEEYDTLVSMMGAKDLVTGE